MSGSFVSNFFIHVSVYLSNTPPLSRLVCLPFSVSLSLLIYLTAWRIYWLADRLTDCLIARLTDWLIDSSVDWLVDSLVDWLTDWLTDWPTDRLTDWLTYWPTDCLIDWLTDLTDWPTDWLTDWLTLSLFVFLLFFLLYSLKISLCPHDLVKNSAQQSGLHDLNLMKTLHKMSNLRKNRKNWSSH